MKKKIYKKIVNLRFHNERIEINKIIQTQLRWTNQRFKISFEMRYTKISWLYVFTTYLSTLAMGRVRVYLFSTDEYKISPIKQYQR